jgi:RNA polymerase sigma-70 factor (ECF subfamily)
MVAGDTGEPVKSFNRRQKYFSGRFPEVPLTMVWLGASWRRTFRLRTCGLRVGAAAGTNRFSFVMQTTQQHLNELMRRVAAGDRAAFGKLYAATSAKLYGVVLRILRRRDLADEVMQEAYVRIWNNARSFDPARASPITWMVTIARNRALDEIRKVAPLSLEALPGALDIRDPAMLASDAMEASDDQAKLRRCLDGLEPTQREIVRLAYLEGQSREELAQQFGHPVGTIKTWLHRSLKQLKGCLES